MKFGVRKPESWGYQTVKTTRRWRNHAANFLCFDTIPARGRRTDRQTDGRTRCDRYYPR